MANKKSGTDLEFVKMQTEKGTHAKKFAGSPQEIAAAEKKYADMRIMSISKAGDLLEGESEDLLLIYEMVRDGLEQKSEEYAQVSKIIDDIKARMEGYEEYDKLSSIYKKYIKTTSDTKKIDQIKGAIKRYDEKVRNNYNKKEFSASDKGTAFHALTELYDKGAMAKQIELKNKFPAIRKVRDELKKQGTPEKYIEQIISEIFDSSKQTQSIVNSRSYLGNKLGIDFDILLSPKTAAELYLETEEAKANKDLAPFYFKGSNGRIAVNKYGKTAATKGITAYSAMTPAAKTKLAEYEGGVSFSRNGKRILLGGIADRIYEGLATDDESLVPPEEENMIADIKTGRMHKGYYAQDPLYGLMRTAQTGKEYKKGKIFQIRNTGDDIEARSYNVKMPPLDVAKNMAADAYELYDEAGEIADAIDETADNLEDKDIENLKNKALATYKRIQEIKDKNYKDLVEIETTYETEEHPIFEYEYLKNPDGTDYINKYGKKKIIGKKPVYRKDESGNDIQATWKDILLNGKSIYTDEWKENELIEAIDKLPPDLKEKFLAERVFGTSDYDAATGKYKPRTSGYHLGDGAATKNKGLWDSIRKHYAESLSSGDLVNYHFVKFGELRDAQGNPIENEEYIREQQKLGKSLREIYEPINPEDTYNPKTRIMIDQEHFPFGVLQYNSEKAHMIDENMPGQWMTDKGTEEEPYVNRTGLLYAVNNDMYAPEVGESSKKYNLSLEEDDSYRESAFGELTEPDLRFEHKVGVGDVLPGEETWESMNLRKDMEKSQEDIINETANRMVRVVDLVNRVREFFKRVFEEISYEGTDEEKEALIEAYLAKNDAPLFDQYKVSKEINESYKFQAIDKQSPKKQFEFIKEELEKRNYEQLPDEYKKLVEILSESQTQYLMPQILKAFRSENIGREDVYGNPYHQGQVNEVLKVEEERGVGRYGTFESNAPDYVRDRRIAESLVKEPPEPIIENVDEKTEENIFKNILRDFLTEKGFSKKIVDFIIKKQGDETANISEGLQAAFDEAYDDVANQEVTGEKAKAKNVELNKAESELINSFDKLQEALNLKLKTITSENEKRMEDYEARLASAKWYAGIVEDMHKNIAEEYDRRHNEAIFYKKGWYDENAALEHIHRHSQSFDSKKTYMTPSMDVVPQNDSWIFDGQDEIVEEEQTAENKQGAKKKKHSKKKAPQIQQQPIPNTQIALPSIFDVHATSDTTYDGDQRVKNVIINDVGRVIAQVLEPVIDEKDDKTTLIESIDKNVSQISRQIEGLNKPETAGDQQGKQKADQNEQIAVSGGWGGGYSGKFGYDPTYYLLGLQKRISETDVKIATAEKDIKKPGVSSEYQEAQNSLIAVLKREREDLEKQYDDYMADHSTQIAANFEERRQLIIDEAAARSNIKDAESGMQALKEAKDKYEKLLEENFSYLIEIEKLETSKLKSKSDEETKSIEAKISYIENLRSKTKAELPTVRTAYENALQLTGMGPVEAQAQSQNALDEATKRYIDARFEELIKRARITPQQTSTTGGSGSAPQKQSIWNQLGWNSQGLTRTVTQFFSLYRVLGKVRQSIQKVITITKQLDQAATNIRIVTGKEREEVDNLILSYSKLASEIGTTTTAVAQSANTWLRQGYNINEVNKLITASTQLSKLGMLDINTATKVLTSTLKGFKMEASEATSIVDKFTKLDTKFAASAGEIGEALSRAASLAQQSGMSLDQASAFVTTIMDITQQSAEMAGTSLRTILARYGNVKAGSFVSADEDDVENINDIEKVLSRVGITIRSSNSDMRSFADVLDDISEKWLYLTDVEKNAIATAVAGELAPERIEMCA